MGKGGKTINLSFLYLKRLGDKEVLPNMKKQIRGSKKSRDKETCLKWKSRTINLNKKQTNKQNPKWNGGK